MAGACKTEDEARRAFLIPSPGCWPVPVPSQVCWCRAAGLQLRRSTCNPQLCAHKLLTWVRMTDASLILETGNEPFHLRDHCEQPSHMG